ncbi:MAG TPA: DUF481 domain-containing protein [Silvibacterium sp.]|nr:DUF481 domain-containing protein [Silvibacterium sp.]
MSLARNATPVRPFFSRVCFFTLFALSALTIFNPAETFAAEPDAAKAPPDTIVFTNGDQLSGTFVREIGGTVTFHSDMVGDVNIPWDKIKELHTQTKMAVLNKSVTLPKKGLPSNVPAGTISVASDMVTVHPENNETIPPIPVKDASYIVDQVTLNKQLGREPGFFTAWNGAATAGATIVQSTQKQYTFTGAVALARVIPTVSWLNPRNRTTMDFSGSYGKITQKAFISGGVFYPETDTKTALFHADAERDQYFSPRMYVLGMMAFDHNYSLLLDLQQIYGGGIGWTAIKSPKQELDLKGTLQYAKQSFINAAPGVNQDLIGSTFAGIYLLKLPRDMVFNQEVAYIPAWNNTRAYSVTETDTLAIPAYKNLAVSIGTLDTYLNNPPPAIPSTKRNSFQFTFGATYVIKSKY